MSPTPVTLVMFFFVIFLIIAYLIVLQVLNMELKANHREVWDSLGRPSFFNSSTQNSFYILRFIYSRRYVRIGSHKVTLLGNIVLTVNLIRLSG
jgi:hypothetical protein